MPRVMVAFAFLREKKKPQGVVPLVRQGLMSMYCREKVNIFSTLVLQATNVTSQVVFEHHRDYSHGLNKN